MPSSHLFLLSICALLLASRKRGCWKQVPGLMGKEIRLRADTRTRWQLQRTLSISGSIEWILLSSFLLLTWLWYSTACFTSLFLYIFFMTLEVHGWSLNSRSAFLSPASVSKDIGRCTLPLQHAGFPVIYLICCQPLFLVCPRMTWLFCNLGSSFFLSGMESPLPPTSFWSDL